MLRSQRDGACKVCSGWEPETVDRLLAVGHGIRFVADRWGHRRQDVKSHRDRCLVGERRERVEADLVRLAAPAGGGA